MNAEDRHGPRRLGGESEVLARVLGRLRKQFPALPDDVLEWSASSPTTQQLYASSAPSWRTCTTNGKPATAATCPKRSWRCSTQTAIMQSSPLSTAARRHRGTQPRNPPLCGARPANATEVASIKPRNAHRVHTPRSRADTFICRGRSSGEEHAGKVATRSHRVH